MTHLRESEFVDLLDDVLPAARARHVEECAAVRREDGCAAQHARAGVDVEVPEPSPLFWEHFSARVREGVQDAAPGERAPWSGWWRRARLEWAVAGALMAVVIVAGFWAARTGLTRQPIATIATGPSASGSGASHTASHDDMDDLMKAFDDDAAWSVVRAVADEVHWDDQVTASLEARPGTVERAVLSLTGEARAELIRLLEAETKRPGA